MAVEFRCEKCGKILNVDAEPGSTTRCPHCDKKIVVPAGLASLPRPQVPPGERVASAEATPTSAVTPSAEAQIAPQEYYEEESAVMGVMANIMPWVISIFFHVGLGLIMAFVTLFVVESKIPKDVVIPNAFLGEEMGATINPSDRDPERDKNPQQKQNTRYSQQETKIQRDTAQTKKTVRLIGAGSGAMGAAAPAGLSMGGPSGPRSAFMGLSGNAHYVVYVVDRSGSMSETFDFVRDQIIKSIARLGKRQYFHVILFADGPPLENRPGRLVPATETYMLEVADFVRSVEAQGQTNPVPALNAAFKVLHEATQLSGKLIYLLTDGRFPDNDAVLKTIDANNRDRSVHINTYLYGPPDPQFEKILERIAEQNGGRYKRVSQDE
ncbi:MAG TPA: VWA domain-containing protein [Phycisphaerae bacterium]|nr:VWA domain-containing protein [Phycisphaerae bacterium]